MFKVPKIKVFGVGGAGCYLIDKAIEREISTAEYYVIDDDYGRLQISKCANKIQLIGGDHAGADYDYSQKTAIANKDLIFDSVKGADLIVVVAGMGGGMGSAVPSIIAEIAKENNIIAVAIVVTPFVFEGEKRLKNAERGIQALREKANMTLIMPCEKATSCLPENAPISDVIKLSDEMVIDALKTIVEPITMPAVINLEFEDTVLALKESKNTFFGMGIGKGKEKCIEAVRYAINCPMASATIDKATSVILYVEGGDDLTMDDMQEVATLVNAVTDEKANIFFAANINSKLTGELKVSLLGAKNEDDRRYVNITFPSSKTKRGRVGKGIAQTLTCGDGNAIVTENVRIRKLTPRECLRLMGWNDEQIDKIAAVNVSATQQYRQAGNGIVVQVLEFIFKALFMGEV